MKVKIIISCWPSFLKCSTQGMRASLEILGGSRILEVLDKHGEYNIPGYGFRNGDIDFVVYPSSHCYLSTSKNNGINSFSGSIKKQQNITDCDFILLMDADHSFLPEQINKLLKNDLPIVGGAYKYRHSCLSECYVAGDMRENGELKDRLHISSTGLNKVHWVGGGFVLVKVEVFNKLEFPWFRGGVVDMGDTANELGEDIGFCLQAMKANIPVYCDCDCRVGHSR